MRVVDYSSVELPGEELAPFCAAQTGYLRDVVAGEVLGWPQALLSASEREVMRAVGNTSVHARRGAPIAVERAPVLLVHPGLGGAYADNFVLYELLASRGWVVVGGLFQQASGAGLGVQWDPSTSVLDLDVLRAEVSPSMGVEPTSIAVAGHSYGAQAVLLYASMRRDVSAVISFDSTIENASGPQPWWKDEQHGPWLDHAPENRTPAMLLASEGASADYFRELGGHPRHFVTIADLRHNEFESFGGALRPRTGTCGPARRCDLVRDRYLAAVGLASAFLDDRVEAGDSPTPRPSDAELRRLSINTIVAVEGGAPVDTAEFPPLDAPLDCRFEGNCEPGELSLEQAQELAALGRPEAALALLESTEGREGDPGLLHQRGVVLAALGRYQDAALAFEREAMVFASIVDGPPVLDALERRANAHADRARELARE